MNTDTLMAPTMGAPQGKNLDWSTETVQEDTTHGHSWKATAALAASILAPTAAGMFLAMSHLTSTTANTSTVSVDSHPVTTAQSASPDVPIALPDMTNQDSQAIPANPVQRSDNIYISLLRQADFDISSTSDAIDYGHIICNARYQGFSDQKIVQIESMSHPEVTPPYAAIQVHAAEVAYCSQYLPGV